MIRIDITFHGKFATQEDTTTLADQLRQADLSIEEQRRSPAEPGVRDGGVVVGIAVASLAVSAVSAFVSALSYWHSTRPKFTVTVQNDDITVTVGNLATKTAKETIYALLANAQPQDVKVSLMCSDNENNAQ